MTPEEHAEYRSVSKLLNHIQQMVHDLGLGKVMTVLSMLKEHAAEIASIKARLNELENNR